MTKELDEYRDQLINQLVKSVVRFREACLETRDPHQPLEAGGWNVHQVAVHTRDVHQLVYAVRARRTAEEDEPEFPNFDSDAYMMEHYNREEALADLLNDFVEDVESFAAMLHGLPVEAWSRESHHAIMGSGFTLQTWVERALAHMEEHINTIKMQR